MKKKLSKLLDVKSIVTIISTLIFAYLSITQVINSEQFLMIFTTIIAFYFGTQANKNLTTHDKKKEDN